MNYPSLKWYEDKCLSVIAFDTEKQALDHKRNRINFSIFLFHTNSTWYENKLSEAEAVPIEADLEGEKYSFKVWTTEDKHLHFLSTPKNKHLTTYLHIRYWEDSELFAVSLCNYHVSS